MALFFLTSCDSESDRPEVDGDGLTADVRQLVPPAVLDGLAEIGHPIYGGANPPDITDTFWMDPRLLSGSNLAGDTLPTGTDIGGTHAYFADQSSDLVLRVSYKAINSGVNPADRSFIVGNGCRFTVFSEYANLNGAGQPWSNLTVFSGCLTEAGIEDAVYTNVLLEDREQIFNNAWLPGQGRSFTDGDGLSERQ